MTELVVIDANGVRFACLADGSGPLVLLAHGFPDTPHTFADIRRALAAAGYRAVSPFMRGYAPTEVPADGRYDAATLGRDVLAWIDAFGARDAILIGHDWGAAAAYMAASLAPERVRFLVTIATPHPAAVKPNLRLLWRARHFMSLSRRNAAAMVRAREYAYVDELVQRWSPAWHMPPDATRAVKDVFANDACLDAALAYYRAAVADRRVPKELRTPVRVPSTVFAGSDDGVLEVSDFERARRCFAAPHQLVVLPGGHFLHREHPARFIEALLAALPRT